MAMNLDYPPGATPLDPDEAQGLIPKHILNHGQINEWEFQNVLKGERWAFGRKHKNMLEIQFIRQLHKRMFGDTWRIAGWQTPRTMGPCLHSCVREIATQRSYWRRSAPDRRVECHAVQSGGRGICHQDALTL